MRKAFTLIELLVVLALIAVLSPAFAKLSRTLFYEVPVSYRIVENSSILLKPLQKLQQDIEFALTLPDSFQQYTAGPDTLIIESADSIIVYKLHQDILYRYIAGSQSTDKWPLKSGRIEWQILQKNGQNYAVEIQNYIEHEIEGRLKKKMANSHIYFASLWPKGAK